jgi:hypothetical protein
MVSEHLESCYDTVVIQRGMAQCHPRRHRRACSPSLKLDLSLYRTWPVSPALPRKPARTRRGSDRDSNRVVVAAVVARIERGEDQAVVLHREVGAS